MATAIGPAERRGDQRRLRRPRWPHPAEGWAVLGLHALVLLAAAWAVQRADWADGLGLLPVIALAGGMTGCVLAKTTAADLAAHVGAFWSGVVLVVLQTSLTYDALGPTPPDRLSALAARAETWVRDTARGDQGNDLALFVVLMGVTMWLVAYISAWTLYRRQWLLASTLLPGFVVLVNVGYQPGVGTAPLVLYLLAACALAAGHFAYRRRVEWRGFDIPSPAGLPWRFLGVGVNVGLVVVVAAWTLPIGARNQAVDAAWDRVERPLAAAAERWQELLPMPEGQGREVAATYAEFGASFEMGGPLDLGDAPVLYLQAASSAYLSAQHYDRYDGFGWESDVDRTFEARGADGATYSSQMRFAAGQAVGLSGEIVRTTEPTTGAITVLRPTGARLFTVGTHEKADRPTSVQLSWQQLDGARFGIADGDLPPDLRRLASLVDGKSFGPPDAAGVRVARDGTQAELISRELDQLGGRFLRVGFEFEGDRVVGLVVDGQVPVYDDVEAVFAQAPPEVGDRYTVTGRATEATERQLRAAGVDYPAFAVDRYLELPTTVTPRTRDLAARVAEASDNPYDAAIAVQDFLRDHITYREDIAVPPSDQDVVDWVLFETREGYCEYYASSMAVMLRSLGIPSRVVSGFYPAAPDDASTGFVYTEQQAHLWVEVYFPGYGWIPFEPTASQDRLDYGADRRQAAPAATPSPVAQEPVAAPTATPEPSPTPTAPAAVAPITADDGGVLDEPSGWATLVGLVLLVLVALAAIGLTVAWWRGLGGLSPAASVWARVLKAGRWLGVRGDPTLTPAEYANELGRVAPSARLPARAAAERYAAERYGGRSDATTDPGRDADWRRVRAAALRAVARRRRR